MYVVAQTELPGADTVLVRFRRDKFTAGRDSIAIERMGRKAFTVGSSARDLFSCCRSSCPV